MPFARLPPLLVKKCADQLKAAPGAPSAHAKESSDFRQ